MMKTFKKLLPVIGIYLALGVAFLMDSDFRLFAQQPGDPVFYGDVETMIADAQVGGIDSAVAQSIVSDTANAIRTELETIAGGIAGDTADVLRTELATTAGGIAHDTIVVWAVVLRGEMSDTSSAWADIANGWIGDSAAVLRAELATTAGGIAGDTADVVRAEIPGVAGGVAGDTATVIRAEIQDIAAGVTGDSLTNVWSVTDALAAEIDTIQVYVYTSNGHVGIKDNDPGNNLPNDWSDIAQSHFLEVGADNASADAGIGVRSNDDNEGLDIWVDGDSGVVFIDSRRNNPAGDLIFRVKSLGTKVVALIMHGDGSLTVSDAYKLPSASGPNEYVLKSDGTDVEWQPDMGGGMGSDTVLIVALMKDNIPGWVHDSLNALRGELPGGTGLDSALVQDWAGDSARAAAGDSVAGIHTSVTNLETAVDSINPNVAENTTDIAYARGLSLIPSDYWGITIDDIVFKWDDYVDVENKKWDDAADGTHGHDTGNKLTDNQSVSLTGDAANDGIHIVATIDLTHFSCGDTIKKEDYFCFAAWTPSGDSAKLGDNAMDIILANDAEGTLTNYFIYPIADTYFADNSWTFFKIALSAIDDSTVGSPSLNSITGLSISFADAPSAEVTISFDNFQVIKKAQGGAWPNVFQHETTNGTWENVFVQGGGKNVTIVNEGRLGVVNLDGSSSNIVCVSAFEDYKLSGKMKLGTTVTTVLQYRSTGAYMIVRSNTDFLELYDSTATKHEVAFVSADGDEIYWRFSRKGTSIIASVSHTGLSGDWTSVSTFGWAGVLTPMKLNPGVADARIYGFALSTVEHAEHAAVADIVSGLGGASAIRDVVHDTADVLRGEMGGSFFSQATTTIGHPESGASLVLYHDGDGDSILNIALGYIPDSSKGNRVIELKLDSLLIDDTVFVQGNDWILRGSGENRIKLSGAIYAFVDTIGYNNWTVEGFNWDSDANCLGLFHSGSDCDSVTWRNNQVRNMSSTSSKLFSTTSGSDHWVFENLKIYDCYQFRHDGRAATFQGIEVYRPTKYGLYLNIEALQTSLIKVIHPTEYGIYLDDLGGGTGYSADENGFNVIGTLIEFEDTSSSHVGLYIEGAANSNGTVANTTVIGGGGVARGGGAASGGIGVYFNVASSSLVNTNTSNMGTGIYVGTGSSVSSIQGGVHQLSTTGIDVYGDYNTFLSIHIVNSTTGLNIQSGADYNGYEALTVYNGTAVTDGGANTIAGTTNGVIDY